MREWVEGDAGVASARGAGARGAGAANARARRASGGARASTVTRDGGGTTVAFLCSRTRGVRGEWGGERLTDASIFSRTFSSSQAVPSCSPCCSSRNIDVFTVPTCAEDGLKVDLLETVKKLDALHARSRRADEAGVPRRVLVYCMSGQSRAPSVAVAYLMYSERRGVEDAIKSLNRRYPRGHPGVRLKPADTESLRNSRRNCTPPRARRGTRRPGRRVIRFDSIRFDSIRFDSIRASRRRPSTTARE